MKKLIKLSLLCSTLAMAEHNLDVQVKAVGQDLKKSCVFNAETQTYAADESNLFVKATILSENEESVVINATVSTKNESGNMVLIMAPMIKAEWGTAALVQVSNEAGESAIFEVVATK